jgi:two-component system alkaline phosphatase synthesis response regulator PhoP
MLDSQERRGAMPKVLVVDDDPDLVETITAFLEAQDYEVIQAYGGIEGLQKVRSEKPDVVVLDVMMPDKDGFEVCKEMKADPSLSTIPVLLLTAVGSKIHESRYTLRMGMETEADDYVDKPVDPEEIATRVKKLLSR